VSALYIGLMSGTSADGVDVGVFRFVPQPETLAYRQRAYPPALRNAILTMSNPSQSFTAYQWGELDQRLGQFFAESVLELLAETDLTARDILAIGSHGHTVCHAPDQPWPFTWQLGDPHRIAEITGITTVADFRRRDMAAGGQGAPLVPALHRALFQTQKETRVVLNLGGIANITVLPADPTALVTGFDTGPANTLLDAWTQRHLGLHYDADGDWARGGRIAWHWVDKCLQEPYFSRPPPKSTGRELFSLAWLDERVAPAHLTAQDVQASLCALTARSAAQAILRYAPDVQRVLVCGGGVHNGFVMALLRHELPCQVVSTARVGVDPDAIEAMAFAWLAQQTLSGLPGNLCAVTGARHPVILGAIHPAAVR